MSMGSDVVKLDSSDLAKVELMKKHVSFFTPEHHKAHIWGCDAEGDVSRGCVFIWVCLTGNNFKLRFLSKRLEVDDFFCFNFLSGLYEPFMFPKKLGFDVLNFFWTDVLLEELSWLRMKGRL